MVTAGQWFSDPYSFSVYLAGPLLSGRAIPSPLLTYLLIYLQYQCGLTILFYSMDYDPFLLAFTLMPRFGQAASWVIILLALPYSLNKMFQLHLARSLP